MTQELHASCVSDQSRRSSWQIFLQLALQVEIVLKDVNIILVRVFGLGCLQQSLA